MISNEHLSAYLDGELSPEEMARIEQAVANDELLAARLRRFRELDRLVAEFASGIDAEPLPRALRERLGLDADSAQAAGSAVSAETIAVAPGKPRGARRPWFPAALAAGVLLALFAGLRLREDAAAEQFERLVQVGPIPASSPLAHVLERVASDATEAVGPGAGVRITPQLSFVSARAGVCREYRVDAAARAARGLACRRDSTWQTLRVAATAVPSVAETGYSTASGDADAGFDAFVDALIDDAPLGAEDEARLMRRGWRAD